MLRILRSPRYSQGKTSEIYQCLKLSISSAQAMSKSPQALFVYGIRLSLKGLQMVD